MRIPYRIRKIFTIPGISRKGGRRARPDDFWRTIDIADIRYDHSFMSCPCCVQGTNIEQMVQCPEAHLVCKTCLKRYVDFGVGGGKYQIKCFDPSGCQATFSDDQIQKCISENMFKRLQTLRQQQDVRDAALPDFHPCPFCSYGVCLENNTDQPREDGPSNVGDSTVNAGQKPRLFKCRGPGCGLTSCLDCGKQDHLPRTCAEASEMWKVKHELEEVKSDALIRVCPGCQLPFVRDTGCCMMTCSRCQAISCYTCKKPITNDGTRYEDHSECQGTVAIIEQMNVADAIKEYTLQNKPTLPLYLGKSLLAASLFSRGIVSGQRTRRERIDSNATASSYLSMDADDYIMCDVPCWLIQEPRPSEDNESEISSKAKPESDADAEPVVEPEPLPIKDSSALDQTAFRRPSLEEFTGLAVVYA